MSELKMAGNGLKGSRPILNFDSKFDEIPQLQLLKEMFIQTFGTPRAHPKSKPFVDRVMSFVWLDNRIWFRNYQAVWSDDPKNPDDHELSEIGTFRVLCLILVSTQSGR
jgi:ribosome biogenesis protein BRX1